MLPESWNIEKTKAGLVITTPTARETSVCSDKGFIARIVGTCPKYKYKREWCGRKGEFVLPKPGIYEFGNICGKGQSNYSYNKHGGDWKGYFRVNDDWSITVLGKIEFLEAVAEIDKPAVVML